MLHVYRKCFLKTLHDQTFPINTSSGFIGCLPPKFFSTATYHDKNEWPVSVEESSCYETCDQGVRLLVTALARKPGVPHYCWLRCLAAESSVDIVPVLEHDGYLLAIYSSSECSTTHVTRISILNKHGNFPDVFLWNFAHFTGLRVLYCGQGYTSSKLKNSDYCLLVCQGV